MHLGVPDAGGRLESDFDPQRLESALELLRRHAGNDPERHAFPGAVAVVAREGRVALSEAVGRMLIEPGAPAMRVDALFDAASVTKVVVTTTAVMQLVERGDISLDDHIGWYVPELADAPVGQATLAQLLTHTSGLPWIPLFAWGDSWSDWLRAIADIPLEAAPGTRVEYSCPGFILLGRLVELVSGSSLSDFAERRIFAPLGLHETRFLPLAKAIPDELAGRLVMTERRDASIRGEMLERAVERRGSLLQAWGARHHNGFAHGIVHDENAAFLGGVSGNAGLFTTARDLLAFGQVCLDGGRLGASQVLSGASIAAATRDWTGGPASRGLGWMLAGSAGTFGDLASPQAYGHTGFTGALLFIDPSCSVVAVLLTNRLQFGRSNERILRVRRLFLNSVLAAVR